MDKWSFGRKLALGFGAAVLLTLIVSVLAIYALNRVVDAKDRVINVDTRILIYAQELQTIAEQRVVSSRTYLFSRADADLAPQLELDSRFDDTLEKISELAPESGSTIGEISKAESDWQAASRRAHELAVRGSVEEVEAEFINRVRPARRLLSNAVEALTADRERIRQSAAEAASKLRDQTATWLFWLGFASVLFGALAAFVLSSSLGRQLSTAATQVQSSSAELQAAATQQASGSREQATAMTEISTTISELLATSRQIAESSQRVANMAKETAQSAKGGSETMSLADSSMLTVREQVRRVVEHMLELGKKSQQIGGVLDIVLELAEQTNILAINATIEASGAGEAGLRFGVVADEIRKLADRVGGSAKEIRSLIDEVRGAVHTTVMATESSSKAADASTQQFNNVLASFERIASLVTTTTEAAREIELSTKQQATAVEQVNVAINSAAQATKEGEASSTQTLQTASELVGLAKSLLRVVQPQQP